MRSLLAWGLLLALCVGLYAACADADAHPGRTRSVMSRVFVATSAASDTGDAGSDAGLDASFQFANASDDYTTCPDRAGFDSSGDGKEFSAGCWVRRTALENSEIFFSQTNAGTDLKFAIQAQDSTGGSTYDDIVVYFADTSASWRSCPTNVNMATNTWYLVVAVYDGNAAGSEVQLSVNGAAKTIGSCSGSVPSTLRNSAGDVKIGHYSDASNSVFAWNGQVADCYIWNEALTNGELSTLYNSGTPLPYASVSPAPDFMVKGCTRNGTGGYPQVAPETGGADCVATNGPTCVSTYPP